MTLTPQQLFAHALSHVVQNDAGGLRHCAQLYLQSAGDASGFLYAAELFELAGDLPGAEKALLEGHARLPWSQQAPLGQRMQGLQVQKSMGDDLLAFTVSLGWTAGAAADEDAAAGRRLGLMLAVLKSMGLISSGDLARPDWEPMTGLARAYEQCFGRWMVELLKLSVFLILDESELVEQTAFKVVPYLERLDPQAALKGKMSIPFERVEAILSDASGGANTYLALARDDDALQTALQKNPQLIEGRLQRAVRRLGAGDREGAQQELEALLSYAPWHSRALWVRGSLLLDQARLEEAGQAFRSALQSNPWHLHAWLSLAILQSRKGEVDAVLSTVRRVLELAPPEEKGNAMFIAGTALLDGGRPAEAVAWLRDSVRWEPGRAEAHVNLAIALLETEQAGPALEHLNRGIQLNGSLYNAFLYRARLFAALGRDQDARSDYQTVMSAARGTDLARKAEEELARLWG